VRVMSADWPPLLDRRASHRVPGSAPDGVLERLAYHGEVQSYYAGEVVAPRDQPDEDLIVRYSGRIVVHVEHGSRQRHTMGSRGGSAPASCRASGRLLHGKQLPQLATP